MTGKNWSSAYAWELPIWADMQGNLCTNMDEEVDEATQKAFWAFYDGIFDMTASSIDESTLPEDYPQNVANFVSFMDKESFDLFTTQQPYEDTAVDCSADASVCTGS